MKTHTWRDRYNAMLAKLPEQARDAYRATGYGLRCYLFYKPASGKADGELAIAPEAPAGYVLAYPEPLDAIPIPSLSLRLKPLIDRLPLIGSPD